MSIDSYSYITIKGNGLNKLKQDLDRYFKYKDAVSKRVGKDFIKRNSIKKQMLLESGYKGSTTFFAPHHNKDLYNKIKEMESNSQFSKYDEETTLGDFLLYKGIITKSIFNKIKNINYLGLDYPSYFTTEVNIVTYIAEPEIQLLELLCKEYGVTYDLYFEDLNSEIYYDTSGEFNYLCDNQCSDLNDGDSNGFGNTIMEAFKSVQTSEEVFNFVTGVLSSTSEDSILNQFPTHLPSDDSDEQRKELMEVYSNFNKFDGGNAEASLKAWNAIGEDFGFNIIQRSEVVLYRNSDILSDVLDGSLDTKMKNEKIKNNIRYKARRKRYKRKRR